MNIEDLPDKLKDDKIALELLSLPKAIDDCHKFIAEKDAEVNLLRLKLELEEDKIKKSVYFDDKLTNKEKRETTLKEMVLNNKEIITVKEKLSAVLKQKDTAEIELKFLYNKFISVKYIVRLLETKDN